jgi:signal peptide peptidase SppA
MEIGNLLLSKLAITPWCLHNGMLEVFQNVFTNKVNNLPLSKLEKAEPVRDRDAYISYQVINERAIIPIHGVVLKKSMGMEGYSGMETTLNIENTLLHAEENKAVKEIIMDYDTPGGSSEGIAEVSALIRRIRETKPIFSIVNDSMFSAGYWMGAQGSAIYGWKTSGVGSIGVYMMHVDQSERNASEGIKVTYIKAGKYKAMGNQHEPLSSEAKDELQRIVDSTYSLFIEEVALGRGKSVEDIVSIADAKLFFGQEAKDAGLIDELKTFQDVISYSNTYGFLKSKGDPMFDKKLKDASLDELKAERSDLVAAIQAEVKAEISAELEALKARNEQASKIRKLAANLNKHAEGEALISEGKSVEDAALSLTEASQEERKEKQEIFYKSAPAASGSCSEGSKEDLLEPQTMQEAFEYVKKTQDVKSKSATWKAARKEFPHIFRN